MENLHIENSADILENKNLELVERKGLGHPDSICDGIAEAVSRNLCKEYRDRYGKILHHNTDEVQLVAGSSNPELGGGEIVEPIYILLAGRATKEFKDEKIPVDRIALEAAKDYIDRNFDVLSSEHVELESRIGETSTDLKSVFSSDVPASNDTSFGVGHAPLSRTEKSVKKIEKSLIKRIDEVGEDIKVMGLRKKRELEVTVAAAGISSRISSLDQYIQVKEKVEQKSRKVVESETDLSPNIDVNVADEHEEDSIYLTVTGTSAEMGDDGSVGRGNRVNGLITPHRSMSLEAASGKNPVTHVGKIYNLLSQEIAREIHRRTGKFAQVKMLSSIGSPIDEPRNIEIKTRADEKTCTEVVDEKLENIGGITEKCVKGNLETF